MKFFIGVLALTVIGAIFVMPVVLLLGLHPLTASDRQSLEKDRGKLSHIERELARPARAATAVN
ncbi:MAG TPA: hypothetical protein VEW64_01770 [Methyloceanibacter sp.]|jgi:hypothetical protein|nr:hypothetical protein [Methyloceanibacter sp.]